MRHEHSRTLLDYWNSLRGSRPAPERSEIEPSDVRQILGDTFILEVSRQLRTISYRLAGTRLCAAYGRELKGLGYLALWQEEDNYQIVRSINRVYSSYKPTTIIYSAISRTERVVEYEALLLPLLPTSDGNSRILGVASPTSVPYWLGADALTTNQLLSVRTIDPEATPSLVPSTQSGPSVAAPRRKGHLMVFDGGRVNAQQ